ncbi:MAG: hypothetical protein M1820_001786 [Bogoriella megaspora]|nr:MAG: hypothetical protein M1820_001786 [Bogoriella megaspora]
MSASPAPEGEDPSKKIAFRFCRECSNMLNPREDRAGSNNLIFQCGMCDHTEHADVQCVWRHELSNTVGETAGITQDVAADPSVGEISAQTSTQVPSTATGRASGKAPVEEKAEPQSNGCISPGYLSTSMSQSLILENDTSNYVPASASQSPAVGSSKMTENSDLTMCCTLCGRWIICTACGRTAEGSASGEYGGDEVDCYMDDGPTSDDYDKDYDRNDSVYSPI